MFIGKAKAVEYKIRGMHIKESLWRVQKEESLKDKQYGMCREIIMKKTEMRKGNNDFEGINAH